jgi:hypothetical protein
MNEQQQVKLSDLSVEQLKALAYDQIVMVNRGQQAIAALEGEIQRRASEAVPGDDAEKVEYWRTKYEEAHRQAAQDLKAEPSEILPRGPMHPAVIQEL